MSATHPPDPGIVRALAGASHRTVTPEHVLSAEHNPRHRYLQDVGNTDPTALPQRLRTPEAHDEEDATAPVPEEPPAQAKPTLTSSQVYRVRLAENSCRELRNVAFLDMSPTDQVLYFNRLRRDSEELLRIIRLTTEGA